MSSNLASLKVFPRADTFFIPRVMEDNGTLKQSLSCRYLLYKRIISPLFCTMFCTMHFFPPICTHESFLFRRIVKFLVLTFWYCVDPTNSGKRGSSYMLHVQGCVGMILFIAICLFFKSTNNLLQRKFWFSH